MSEKRYPRRCTKYSDYCGGWRSFDELGYVELREPDGNWFAVDGSEVRKSAGAFDARVSEGVWLETFDHLPPIEQPTDKDAHGMCKAEPSELAALQVQIRRVVDQCEAVIGDKAHAIPFGMAVSETIATLTKRAELAEAGAANFHIDIAKALFGSDWRNTLLHSILAEIELLQKRDEAYEKLKDGLHALALAAPAAEVTG